MKFDCIGTYAPYHKLTWTKNDCIPDHQIVGARSTADASWRISGQPLEIPNETSLSRGGLRESEGRDDGRSISAAKAVYIDPFETYHFDTGVGKARLYQREW